MTIWDFCNRLIVMKDNIYTTGEYIRKNPTLDVEDTPWKLTKVIPLVDEFLRDSSLKEVTLLDVGGGAGLILKEISTYLKKMNISEALAKVLKEDNLSFRVKREIFYNQ